MRGHRGLSLLKMNLSGTTITFTLSELSEQALGHLVALAAQTEAQHAHLSGAVPEEHADGLERSAIQWGTVADRARQEIRDRHAARAAQCERLDTLRASRRVAVAPLG